MSIRGPIHGHQWDYLQRNVLYEIISSFFGKTQQAHSCPSPVFFGIKKGQIHDHEHVLWQQEWAHASVSVIP